MGSGGFCSYRFPLLWDAFVSTLTDSCNSKSHYTRGCESKDEQHRNHAGPGLVPLPPKPVTRLPKVEKLVAIGDVHGDVEKARRAFRLAGIVDENGAWSGGDCVVVQVGDILDRGHNEVEMYYWFEKLQREAKESGGAVYILNGNHETMNVGKQFRYATPGGFKDFSKWARTHAMEIVLKSKCKPCSQERIKFAKEYLQSSMEDGPSSRFAALRPGGDFSRRFIAPNPVILQIGSTIFVHGGLLPHHVEYGIERINNETQDWVLNKKVEDKPAFLSGRRAVVWARDYSHEDESKCDCDALQDALKNIPGAKRMIVGHTIQSNGINSACNEQVFRVDVGLSRGCGDGTPEVLVIEDDTHISRIIEEEPSDSAESKLHQLEEMNEKLLHEE